jgi:hypothetical protein
MSQQTITLTTSYLTPACQFYGLTGTVEITADEVAV